MNQVTGVSKDLTMSSKEIAELTGKAAMLEGFLFIGIELDPDYFDSAKQRIEAAQKTN